MVEITEMDRIKAIFEGMTEAWNDFDIDIDETKKEVRISHWKGDHPEIVIKYTEIKFEES